MITLTDKQKERLRSNNVKKNWTFEIYNGDAFVGYIPTANMVDDSFSIKEALSTSESIEIGACEAATLTVQVADISYSLKGKNLKVWLNVEYDGESLTLPMGRFYVDECKNKNGTYFYDITAYDGMSLFDVDASGWYQELSFPLTIKAMRDSLCDFIGVDQESVTLPCDEVIISESISNFALTARNVLKAICQLNGCFGHFTREGNLTYVYLDNTSTLILKEGGEDCYQTSATHEETTSGEFDSVSITPYDASSSDDENVTYSGDGDGLNTLNIQDNFLTYGMDEETLSAIAEILYDKTTNHPYVVHNTPTQGRVWQEVGDSITLEVESYGETVTFDTFILERKLSGFQAASDTYSAKGTETSDSLSVLSAREMATATSILTKAEAIVDARESALREFNSIISSAIGLYEIIETDDNGATIYYYANAATIAEATLVYTFNAGGFAWGTKEKDADELPETWNYGITNDGNAILNYLSVNQLTADYIAANAITAEKIQAGAITAEKIAAETITADKLKVGSDNGLAKVAVSGSYSDLTDAPDLQGYIQVDGTIGSTPEDGATGFVVSSDGLLQASNAIIYGTLYSSIGVIGGLTLLDKGLLLINTTTDDDGNETEETLFSLTESGLSVPSVFNLETIAFVSGALLSDDFDGEMASVTASITEVALNYIAIQASLDKAAKEDTAVDILCMYRTIAGVLITVVITVTFLEGETSATGSVTVDAGNIDLVRVVGCIPASIPAEGGVPQISMTGNFLPATTETYALGDSSYYWASVYTRDVSGGKSLYLTAPNVYYRTSSSSDTAYALTALFKGNSYSMVQRYFYYVRTTAKPDSGTTWTGIYFYCATICLGAYYLHCAKLGESIASDAWLYFPDTTAIAAWISPSEDTTISGTPTPVCGSYIGNASSANMFDPTTGKASGYPVWLIDTNTADAGTLLFWISTTE